MCFALDTFEGFEETWHLFVIIVQEKNEHVIKSVTLIHANDILERGNTVLEAPAEPVEIRH